VTTNTRLLVAKLGFDHHRKSRRRLLGRLGRSEQGLSLIEVLEVSITFARLEFARYQNSKVNQAV
jgi:hypothetical protein